MRPPARPHQLPLQPLRSPARLQQLLLWPAFPQQLPLQPEHPPARPQQQPLRCCQPLLLSPPPSHAASRGAAGPGSLPVPSCRGLAWCCWCRPPGPCLHLQSPAWWMTRRAVAVGQQETHRLCVVGLTGLLDTRARQFRRHTSCEESGCFLAQATCHFCLLAHTCANTYSYKVIHPAHLWCHAPAAAAEALEPSGAVSCRRSCAAVVHTLVPPAGCCLLVVTEAVCSSSQVLC